MEKLAIKNMLYKSLEVKKFCDENKLTDNEIILNMASLFTFTSKLIPTISIIIFCITSDILLWFT